VPRSQWCWPAGGASPPAVRRCAAAFHVRAAAGLAPASAPVGSAAAASAGVAEAAALAAARHLEHIGLPAPAQAWGCLAAAHSGSEHGCLLCAALETEAWEGHPRNLSGAWEGLDRLMQGASFGGQVAARGALAWAVARFLRAAVAGCYLSAHGAVCPHLGAEAAVWGLIPADSYKAGLFMEDGDLLARQALLEWALTALAVIAMLVATLLAVGLIVLALRAQPWTRAARAGGQEAGAE